jgi:hypothetical protein
VIIIIIGFGCEFFLELEALLDFSTLKEHFILFLSNKLGFYGN